MRISFVAFILILFLSTLIFVGCKQYEENNGITLRSVNNRIEGNYVFEIETINGQTVAPFVSDTVFWTLDPEITNIYFDVKSKEEKKSLIQSGEQESLMNKTGKCKIEMSDGTALGTVFELSNNKSEISFYSEFILPNIHLAFSSNLPGYLFMFNQKEDDYYLTDTWQISKLTKSELWIHTNFNGNEYEVHLKKI